MYSGEGCTIHQKQKPYFCAMIKVCVCVRAYMHACLSVCLGQRRISSFIPQALSIFFPLFFPFIFSHKVFHRLQLAQARLPKNPRDPPTSGSLPPQCRHCKTHTIMPSFLKGWVLGIKLKSSCLKSRHFTD